MPTNNWNEQFIDDYEKLRRFLRPASYGCFSRKDICQQLDIANRRYQQLLKDCKDILPEDFFKSDGMKLHRRPALNGDMYHTNDNFLAKTYFLKSFSEKDIYLDLSLLQILQYQFLHCESDVSLNAKEILQLLEQTAASFSFPYAARISERTVQKHLEYLSTIGFIFKADKTSEPRYQIVTNILEELTTKQLKKLLWAVAFYRNLDYLAVPGYYLTASLEHILQKPDSVRFPFLYQNYDIRRIIDDDLAYRLMQAIQYNKDEQNNKVVVLSFDYLDPAKKDNRSWKKEIAKDPVALITDDLAGSRQRLRVENLDFTPRKSNKTYRLDGMRNVKITVESRERVDLISQSKKPPSPQYETLTIKFHYKTLAQKKNLQTRIRYILPLSKSIFEDVSDDIFSCELSIPTDHRSILPLLRSFLPFIEIPKEENDLYHRMSDQIKEALKNYGID